MVNVCFGQQNVGRAIAVTNVLKVDFDDYDVVYIQKPYMLSNGKAGCLSKVVTSYYSKTAATERTTAVVIVVNRNFPVV